MVLEQLLYLGIKYIEDIQFFVEYGIYFTECSGKYTYFHFTSEIKDIITKNI